MAKEPQRIALRLFFVSLVENSVEHAMFLVIYYKQLYFYDRHYVL